MYRTPRTSEALAKSGNFPDDGASLSMETGPRNGIQMRSILLNDGRQAGSITDGPQRIGADVDERGHRPGTFDQCRQTEGVNPEASLLKSRQPPRFHDRADLRDAFGQAKFLNCGHQS